MRIREATQQYRLTQWVERLREQKSSGQTIYEWCDSRGVSRNQFFYWQRKLREAVTQEFAPSEPKQLAAPSGWTSVTEAESEAPSATQTVVIEVGHCRVLAEAGTDMELLAKVCKALAEQC